MNSIFSRIGRNSVSKATVGAGLLASLYTGSQGEAASLPIGKLNLSGDVHKVDCLAGNSDSKTKVFQEGILRGQEFTYRSSKDVPYNQTNWPWYASFGMDALNLPYGPSRVGIVVVDIRNVNGVPHYAYFSNGTWNRLDQNWSSTKVVAQLAAIHKIRLASDFEIGAGAQVGNYSWSNLVHLLHFRSSNIAGEVFKQVAGLHSESELSATTFVRGWLARPSAQFNGGYGAGLRNSHFDIRSGSDSLRIGVSRQSVTRNLLSALTMAEYWKRIGVNRRDDRLMPKGRNTAGRYIGSAELSTLDSYRKVSSTGEQYQNRYAPTDIFEKPTTITLNDLYYLMYGGVNTQADNRTHGNGMVWDGGLRGRFLDRNAFYRRTGGEGKVIGKTGSSIPAHSAFGGHVCIPDRENPENGREFAFFILGHGGGGVSSETVVRSVFGKVMQTFGGF